MTSELETAEHPKGLKRTVIEPLTRVEGHGKVTLLQDEKQNIKQARLHISEFRGFEKFIQGRPYWELPLSLIHISEPTRRATISRMPSSA